ncbi:MAG: glycosyltransferase family 4 protein [Anaerolineales bacterium]
MGLLSMRFAVQIGLVVYGALSQISGGYLYDRQMVAELEDRGYLIDVIDLPIRPYPSSLIDNFRPAVLNRLSSMEADIVIEDELCHPSLVWQRRSGRANSRTRVALVHHLRHLESHPAPLRSFYRVVERSYLGSVDGVICTSRASRRAVERTVGGKIPAAVAYPGRDHLAPNITKDEIQQRATQGGPLRVLFVGSITRRKRPQLLIDALSQLPAGSWRLEIVGRTDAEPDMYRCLQRRIAGDPALAQAIHLHGEVGEQQLIEYYRQADVLCVPSQLEGFGIVYLEAMGFGLPVLAAANGGAGELVESGISGHLIDGDDPHELAHYLEGYWQDRDHLLAHSLAARSRWEQQPDWGDSATVITDFLSDLLEGG